MLQFHVRRGRRDAGVCASAERGWLFSLRDDLIPCLPLSPSPSRKSAAGGGSLCHAVTVFSALSQPPTTPRTATIARANDGQQDGDDATREAPARPFKLDALGDSSLTTTGWLWARGTGVRRDEIGKSLLSYVLTSLRFSFSPWQLASATTGPTYTPPIAKIDLILPKAPTLACDARRAPTNANVPRRMGRLPRRIGTPRMPQKTFSQHIRALTACSKP